MKQNIVFIIFIILISNICTAATIHGSIYSFDLEKQNNSVISINTNPSQTIVSKDGNYNFELEKGEYTITASYFQFKELTDRATEEIIIEDEGDFTIDLILLPYIEDEIIETNENKINFLDILIFIAAITGFIIIIFMLIRSKKMFNEVKQDIEKANNMSDLAKEILDFIKKEKGRTTQKDIRKQFPSSEAKISLVITELEEKGVIKRIKKGRGNVIILN